MALSKEDIAAAQEAFDASSGDFLDPGQIKPNVVGMGIGEKWTAGESTKKAALVVLVNQKIEKDELPKDAQVPAKLGDMQTDVLNVGNLVAGEGEPPKVGTQTLAQRVRPAEGGYSVGHVDITAGTIATCVYDILPDGRASPPKHGIGIPRQYYILSNNHVLANSNEGILGDSILQPGPFDGGTDPADRIATLSQFVAIDFDPPTPRPLHDNLVDAAIAEGEFHHLNREIYWIGYVAGWRRRADVTVGTVVKKTGRTTNFTTGTITVVSAVVDVGYGAGRVARFRDQIITTNISAGGDSGSLVITVDPATCCNVAVGLLFAGSSVATVVNQIENVRRLLRVEVAEQIL